MDIEIILLILAFVILIFPMGKYLYKVFNKEKTIGNEFFGKIEDFIFRICGIKIENMTWKKYGLSMFITNMLMAFIGFIILMIQGILVLNQGNIESMNWYTAFNTAISFITNTNWQTYSGEISATYLSQMLVITFLMFVSAASGISVAIAFIRGICNKDLGNYFEDMVKTIVRILIPLTFIFALVLVSQGVVQTLKEPETINTLEGNRSVINRGPVASLEAIKQIGTNGGGFFGTNSAHPFENPTALTNFLEMLAMMVIPGAVVICFGYFIKNKKQAMAIFSAMMALFILSVAVIFIAEKNGNPLFSKLGLSNIVGNLEGKEIRFGISGSANFSAVTTAFSTGAVNNMHDSLTPIGGLVVLWNMMLNVVFGGSGVGFMNMIMYAIITVFIAGLMVGRTPEFLGKKIESKEVKLIAFTILIHPMIILIPTAISVITTKGTDAITNGGFHGLSQILYAYTSSAANNGSAFAGLNVASLSWNVMTGLVMFFGRYPAIFLLLAVSNSLRDKKSLKETVGTFRTDNRTFVGLLIFVVIVVGALTFLPVLALGPVAEFLTM